MQDLEEIETFLADAPLFLQPWWLEMVAPGEWRYLTVKCGDEIAAAWPVVERKRLGWNLIRMPRVTPWLGPWLRQTDAKPARALGDRKRLLGELIAALPRFSVFHQFFHPGIEDWQPFFWAGFRQTTLYTYRIEETWNLEKVWRGFLEKARTDIRKAEKSLVCERTEDYGVIVDLYEKTLDRQGLRLPFSRETLMRFGEETRRRGCSSVLVARDRTGRIYSGYHLLWDSKTMYLYCGGGEPELRNSGAASLVVWEGIKLAGERRLVFDFEGSMNPNIERFFRGFGGRLVPYYSILKVDARIPFMLMTLIGYLKKRAKRTF